MIEKLEGRLLFKTEFTALSPDSLLVYERDAQSQPDVVFLVRASGSHVDRNHSDPGDTLASAKYPGQGQEDLPGNLGGKATYDGANVTFSFPLRRHGDGGVITGETTTTISVNQGTFSATTDTDMRYKRDGSDFAHFTDVVATTITVTPMVLGHGGTPYTVSINASYDSSRAYGMQGSYMSTYLYRRDLYNDWVFEPSSSRSESSHEGWTGRSETEFTVLGATYTTISNVGQFYMTSGASLWGSMNHFSPLDWTTNCEVTGNLDVTVENRGLAPAAKFSGPETVIAGQPATFTSTSFDPDEPDTTIQFAGIVSHTWKLDDSTLPPTWDERQPTISYSNLTAGPHTITLSVTDNDGRTATVSKTIMVTAPRVELVGVDDSSPKTPRVFFALNAQQAVTWQMGPLGGSLGTLGAGTHELQLPDITSLGGARSELYITATSGGLTSQAGALFDATFRGSQVSKTTRAAYIAIEGYGIRSVSMSLVADVYNHRWSLPGAKWDSFVSAARLVLTSTVPEDTYPVIQTRASVSLALKGFHSGNGLHPTADVGVVGTNGTWSAGFATSLGLYGAAGRSSIVVRFFALTYDETSLRGSMWTLYGADQSMVLASASISRSPNASLLTASTSRLTADRKKTVLQDVLAI